MNDIGWSPVRSVPTSPAPVITSEPVCPPKLSIATVPSWQLKHSLEVPDSWAEKPLDTIGAIDDAIVAWLPEYLAEVAEKEQR